MKTLDPFHVFLAVVVFSTFSALCAGFVGLYEGDTCKSASTFYSHPKSLFDEECFCCAKDGEVTSLEDLKSR